MAEGGRRLKPLPHKTAMCGGMVKGTGERENDDACDDEKDDAFCRGGTSPV